ncbi:hypothetical protein TUM12370_18690 [Salmonella enterica subsp. enterica serovar Choleraesuis]|nr:hypothetical protein TUM12370_18690 [Salmonella enterica subsp. enterica serovar Choleraesuis]
MMTYDRNRNAITVGSRVMINGTGKTGTISSIHGENMSAQQLRRSDVVELQGLDGQYKPVELIRLGMH